MESQATSPAEFEPQEEGVLVTGCSSGIGRATAVYLAKQGFAVFATVRKAIDADALRQLNIPTLIPVCPLDLSKRDQISAVVEMVQKELTLRGKKGLYALINNAGGGEVAPIELMDLDKFHTELQTRLLGPVALVQAFLPMIREARGRLVWIVTPALMPIPYVSSIHACDFAVNCIARTLELELKPWNIPNIMIRCGGVKTAAPNKNNQELAEAYAQWPKDRVGLYAESLHKTQAEFDDFDKKRTEPDEVAKVVYKALSAKNPKRRYLVAHMARLAAIMEVLPQPAVDWIMAKRL